MSAIKKALCVVLLLVLLVIPASVNLVNICDGLCLYVSDGADLVKESVECSTTATSEPILFDYESENNSTALADLRHQTDKSVLSANFSGGDSSSSDFVADKLSCNSISSKSSDLTEVINGLFSSGALTEKIDEQVYLGGYTIGMTIDGDGVTVIGLNEFFCEDGGLCCPSLLAGLQINDVIIGLNGKKIYSSARLSELVGQSDGKKIEVDYIRDGVQCSTTIVPQRDLKAGQYRIGLWTRDSSSGIGTITYVRKNLKFGSLGHAIVDTKGVTVNCKNGGVFECSILGVERGVKGAAGELKGTISFDSKLGSLYANNKFGAFGSFDTLPSFCNRLINVADISEVSPGKAEIYCSLDGNKSEAYRIEIVKAAYQAGKEDRGLVIHVIDDRLLEKTGGIVQGMSGSPIVQNGKLVGAVTHVFVNDPTRGYGIYAKWMLTN